MTEWRTCDTPASGMTAGSDESKQGGGKPKTNRLRRSLKQTQANPSLIKPTRVTRSRYNNVFNKGESPMNESELQQDIVWDATSPSPLRTGKKYSANVGIVDISDIVNRIAPKVGNTLAKSSLLQWVGDSAIPCTPEMQQPRAKKKSPRTNGVDDLLKLAKQFDFNMFRQDEERVNDMHKQSLTLWRTDSEIPPDHEMEDDLDFLFDGPTQHISLNLSQNSLPQSLEVKTVCSANNNFDDDWENDDLLDDSLVFEMTQNPDPFAAPNHCSTQKGSNETKHENNNPSAIPKNALQGTNPNNVQSKSILSEALPKVGNVPETVKPAPHRNVRQNQPGLFPINKALSSPSNFTNSYSMWPLQVENSSYHKPTENSNMKGTVFIKAPASHSVIPEDDLDSLFASDSIWDDKDDDLLCQACDHLESQVQSMEVPVITRSQFLPSNQTERQKFVPVSAPLNSSRYNVNQTTETTQSKYPNNSVYLQSAPWNGSTFTHSLNTNKVPVTVVSGSERPSYIASAGNAGTNSTYRPQNPAAGEGSYESTRVKSTCVAGSTANQQGTGSEAAGKCSVVEIELKKQQAMERRRQRMQTAHILRAPT
uniref:ETAA1 activator of ATR kinase n=1 Tax=Oncorhynchus tshawytscha TaxID=74940 RepID=A0A8C8G8Z3_ONCTS